MGHLMVTPDDAQEYAFTIAEPAAVARAARTGQGGFDYNHDRRALPRRRSGRRRAVRGAAAAVRRPTANAPTSSTRGSCGTSSPGLAARSARGALFYPGRRRRAADAGLRGAMLRQAQRHNPSTWWCGRGVTAVTGDPPGSAADVLRGVRHRPPVRSACAARRQRDCGVWAPDLGASWPGQPRLPIYPARRQPGDHRPPRHAGAHAAARDQLHPLRARHRQGSTRPAPTIPGGHAVNMQPQTNGGCLIGSTRQFRGMDRTLNKELLHRSLLRAQRYAPGLGGRPDRAHVGRPAALRDRQAPADRAVARPVRGLWVADRPRRPRHHLGADHRAVAGAAAHRGLPTSRSTPLRTCRQGFSDEQRRVAFARHERSADGGHVHVRAAGRCRAKAGDTAGDGAVGRRANRCCGQSSRDGAPRGVLCNMGICYECLVRGRRRATAARLHDAGARGHGACERGGKP